MKRPFMLAGFAGAIALFVGLAVAAAGAQGAPGGQAGRGAPPAPTPPCGPNLQADIKIAAKDSRCFELRIYTARGDSIDPLHAVLRDHTSALFKKYGMDIVGFWQPVAKRDTLIYLLAYKDAAARDAAWAAFNADPDWVKTRGEMQKMGVGAQIESIFMSATDYSPMK